MKKGLAVLLTAVMLAGALTGCGKKGTEGASAPPPAQTETKQEEAKNGSSQEEPYEVKMLIALPSESPNEAEVERVISRINEITMEKLNMTLSLRIVPFATYMEQIQLELSSGSDLDLITAASALGPNWVNSGYVVDLTGLLEEYGQDIVNSYATRELATVSNLDGYVYQAPVHKEISQQPSVFFRTDILEKYDLDVSHIKTLADVDALFEQVAEKEPDMWMLAPDNLGTPSKFIPLDALNGGEVAVVLNPAENTTAVNVYETDEFREWCEYNHKWFEKGWINTGAASDSESYYSYIKSGQAFAFFNEYGHPLSESDQENNCGGVDLTMVHLGEPIATTTTAAIFGYAIPSGSKDPVKAMKMLNLLMSDRELMNLLNWGEEGVDYVVNEDGLLDYPEGKDITSVGYHLGAGWILPNQFVCTPWATDGADIYQKIMDYNDSSSISRAMGFTFNPEPVAELISAVSNVKAKYEKALIVGAVDPEEYLPAFIEELKEAGSDEIVAEAQRQLDEFLAGK